MKSTGSNVVRIEAEALRELAERIDGPMAQDFVRAVECLDSCGGRVVVTGMGKSGIIARKIAATLSSTGTPALYLHPAEAVHGDLGMVVRGDVVLALSSSGETEEILQLLVTIRRIGSKLITITGDKLYPPNSISRLQSKNLRWHRLLTSRWIVRSTRRHVRWGSRLRRRPQPCSPWAMRWRSPSQKSVDSKKKILRTFIPAASWARSWRACPS